jgi:hypothetical protein
LKQRHAQPQHGVVQQARVMSGAVWGSPVLVERPRLLVPLAKRHIEGVPVVD